MPAESYDATHAEPEFSGGKRNNHRNKPPMTSSIKKVAVIGIGSMGKPIARHILDAGFDVTVCDTNATNLREFAALGAITTTQPSDCAKCDATIVLVATADQVRAVVLGEDGLLKHVDAERQHHLAVMSTVSPQDMRMLGEALAGTPLRIVDAPVSGGVVGARKATLTVLTGGAEPDVAALRPLFDAVGKKVLYCGLLGAGQTIKIINNIIAISNLMISAEAFRIACAGGLTFDKFVPALEAGSGRNFMTRDPGDAPETYAAWSGSLDQYRAIQKISGKDIDLALSLCPPDVSLPAITALRELIDGAGEETFTNWQVIAGKAQIQPG